MSRTGWKSISWAMMAAGTLMAPFPALAQNEETVSLSAVKDATLYEDTEGDLANGSGAYLFAGTTNEGLLRRALVAFDLAGAVPSGAEITGASLSLNLSRAGSGNGGDTAISLVRAAQDWGEGTSDAGERGGSGAPAEVGDATWLHTFFDTAQWNTPGGDRIAGVAAATAVSSLGHYTWSGTELTAHVQGWLDDPTQNFGWFILGDESSSGMSHRFDSSENPTEGNRPLLTITFIPPTQGGEGEPDLDVAAQTLLDSFTTADGNDDGLLTLAEARSAVAGLSEEQFAELDRNSDSALSEEELENFLQAPGGCSGGLLENLSRILGDLFTIAAAALVLALWHGHHFKMGDSE